jgi:hypothetical protein
MEYLSHDNTEMENQHFAEVFASALIRSGIVPDREMCERWLRKDYVSETELELILDTYEEIMEI